MNKEQLIDTVARRTGSTRGAAEQMCNAMFQTISESLVAGRKVKIVDFGTFEVKERAPRVGRNPKANVPVKIPARRVPYFTPGKSLKAIVNV